MPKQCGPHEIRDGVITRAWAYLPGELEDDHASSYLIHEDDELVSMWDWEYHVMARVTSDECGERRLVPDPRELD
jgi:hypothetical protein